MKLNVTQRTAGKKSESKQLRRAGRIPAIVYKRGKEQADNITLSNEEFNSHLRQVQPGRLSTQVFILVDENGKERRALLKEIQYHVTKYNVLHLDFEELVDDMPVNVKVPIECVGVVDCIGIKLGGVLRQVIRHLKVRCLPKDIPQAFVLDIRTMAQRETRRLKDLDIPETVRPLVDLNEVAVAIVKR
ncbi:MAG: 50S ribosomal protein L25/general stress protein Ctc [Chlamydiales bacterium 38-26]|nr:50S ribosomal protein L25/general stress protein Ctc [Chlamydiales bacterium]OJV11641.1 MAG: 50S ribosomal protein L25/general stress protein Ctc [Chlamydiales bacterium 38-26]